MGRPEVARLVAAMMEARDACRTAVMVAAARADKRRMVGRRLADPRARKRERRTDLAVKQAFYRLTDEQRETILVACASVIGGLHFRDLIAAHGADYAMPNLLNHLAAPDCPRLGSHWDRCGVHYVEPIEGAG